MDLNTFREYIHLHLLSLKQDLQANPTSDNVIDIEGQIYATEHLIEVLDEH